ncbi:MAG: class I SAM-dependent methyltransferase, partial [Limisphaerales bacterium]
MVANSETSQDLRCPVCQLSNLIGWGQKNGFQLYSCKDCTHIFADIRSFPVDLSQSTDVRRYMTHGALDTDLAYYERLCAGESANSHTNVTTELILKDVLERGHFENENWLDIGSGSGYLVSRLKELGIDGVGVEPGGWAQISAEKKKIKVIQGLLTAETFSEKFSYISATDVLEHQSNPYILMNLVKHYLAPHGTAYLSFPFGDSIPARVLKARWAIWAWCIMRPPWASVFHRRCRRPRRPWRCPDPYLSPCLHP